MDVDPEPIEPRLPPPTSRHALVAALFGMFFGAVVFAYHLVSHTIDDLRGVATSGDGVIAIILVGPVAVVYAAGKGVVMGGGTGIAVGLPVGLMVGQARNTWVTLPDETWRRVHLAAALVIVASVVGLLWVVPGWFQ